MNPGAFVLGETAVGSDHQHLVTKAHQMLDRLAQTGDDAIDLRQKCLGEERDAQRAVGTRASEFVRREIASAIKVDPSVEVLGQCNTVERRFSATSRRLA